MDEKFLISGGIPRTLGELMVGHAFKKAELAEIDFQRKTYVPKCTYTTPVSHCSNKKPSIGFTGFCIYKETIYIATRTEVLVLSSHDYSILKVINDPLFNDIHDVSIHDGFLYVAVTGMDAVFIFDLETHEKTIKNVLVFTRTVVFCFLCCIVMYVYVGILRYKSSCGFLLYSYLV